MGFIAKRKEKFENNKFLFSELVKRDFKKKYKRTVLGMFWSVLSPLLMLLVMRLVFTRFFGRTMNHYTTYLFCGNLVFSYFSEATKTGMSALMDNSALFSKVKMSKYLFVLSKNISTLINFGLTLVVFFIFTALDKVPFSASFFSLIYPCLCLVVLNIGFSLTLSAAYVFFRDAMYLYDIFLRLLMYMSAIFYSVDSYSEIGQKLFYINPVYCCIKYFRVAVLDGVVPSMNLHLLCLGHALLAFIIGSIVYTRNNQKFIYYV